MTNDYLNQEFQSIFGILTNYGEIRPLPVFAPIMNELVFEVHSLLFLTELHCHWPIFIKAHICSATDLIGTVVSLLLLIIHKIIWKIEVLLFIHIS